MVAVNPSSNKVYVTLHGEGRLAVIDGVSDTVLTFVDLDARGSYGVAADEPRNLVSAPPLPRPLVGGGGGGGPNGQLPRLAGREAERWPAGVAAYDRRQPQPGGLRSRLGHQLRR